MSSAEPPRGVVAPASGALGRCPACGGPLYGWIEAKAADARRRERYLLDRCERCGLGIMRDTDAEAVDRMLRQARPRPGGGIEIAAPNRRSVQAGLGEGRWAALDLPEAPLVLTPRAARELLTRRGMRIERLATPVPGRNQRWMWQTLINAFTFNANFAREALRGRLRPSGGRERLAFAVDALVTLLAAPLVALVAILLETLAALTRRGGELVVRAAPRGPQSSSSTSPAS